MVDAERLASLFMSLVRIDSVSGEERVIADVLKRRLIQLDAEVFFDDAGARLSGDCGNLIARIPGASDAPPLLLNAHMDTVEPGRGITPVFNNGVFRSDGTTILGADDKSALAIILEVLTVLKEDGIQHAPLEVVFTVSEETGLRGAKVLDCSLLTAPYGYALDATDTAGIVTRAPSANRLEFVVHGKEAHAGVAPERGVSAISVASKAVSRMPPGRVDPETTCNIGIIEGGTATNIVPNRVLVKGEARSHDETKLARVTEQMVAAFEEAVAEQRQNAAPGQDLADVSVTVESDFSRIHIDPDHPVVKIAKKAAANLGRTLKEKTSGGGADANVFFANGIVTGILGTGMEDMHTCHESVPLARMTEAAELLLEIIQTHSAQGEETKG